MTCGQQKNIRKIKDLPSYKKIFEVVNNNLQILGVLPDQSIKLRYFVLLGSLTLMIISELTYFVNMISPENFRDLLDLAPCITSGLNAILKVLCLAVNKKKLFDLIDRLEPIFEDFSKSSQKTIVAKNILRITSVTRFYHYFCMILVTIFSFWIVGAILIHYWQTNEWIFLLPYAVLLPFSVDTWLSWLFVFLFSVINGYICVIGYVTVDCFYIILTSQVCNHFAILSDEILHLDKNNTKKLRHIVIKHQYIFQLSGMLEEIFKASNLFSILMAILEICALEFNIATGDRSQVPAYFMFLSSVICQILMMSIFGENLIRESRKVGESAYLCIWYNMDIKSRKMMLIIMTRASKPAQLTAYNFSIICHETFTSIMSTSWSYFTLLRTVYTPPE